MALSTPPPLDPASPGREKPRGNGSLAHPLPAGMRDLLPEEALRHLSLCRTLLGSFRRFGYEPVSVPPFEYAEVLEHDMGPLDPSQVLRFVEPETGEVVALRPDMTPQIARLVAARFPDTPLPARLCYEGAVVRRRAERARRDRQIHQAGFELVGLPGPAGDLEVLTVAASAVRATGLTEFTLDLGHAGITAALLSGGNPEAHAGIVEALASKDAEETARRAERAGVRGKDLAALVELPYLYGGRDVWERADRTLAGTAAVGPARELRSLVDAAHALGLAPSVVADLGETWSFAYYTGVLFHVLADGPGEAVGAGGRYDRLFDRFRWPQPAAGFAVDLGNLSWALDRSGQSLPGDIRLLVSTVSGAIGADAVLSELRRAAVCCAVAPASDPGEYARAWRYTHVLELSASGAALIDIATRESRAMSSGDARALARAVVTLLSPNSSRSNSEAI